MKTDSKEIAFWIGFCSLCFFFYYFAITRGTFSIVGDEFNGMTDAKTFQRLLEGRFDIPAQVNSENFIRDGKNYTYFGVFPAFVRGLFAPIYYLDTPIPRLSSVLAALLLIFSTIAIGLQLKLHRGKSKPYFLLLTTAILLGGPYVFLTRPAFIYHEFILWGAGLVSLFNFLFIRFATTPAKSPGRALVMMSLVAGLIIITRTVDAIGPIVTLVTIGCLHLLFSRIRPASPPLTSIFAKLTYSSLLGAAAMGLIFTGIFLFFNFKRFGSPWEYSPTRFNIHYLKSPDLTLNKKGQDMEKYGFWRADRIPSAVEFYFWPHADNFMESPPYVTLGDTAHLEHFAAHIDDREPGTQIGLFLSSPLLIIFFAGGLFFILRRPKTSLDLMFQILTFSQFLTWIYFFGFAGECLRYSGDLAPLLVTTSYFGLYKSSKTDWTPQSDRQQLLFIGAIALAAISIYNCNVTSAQYEQKITPWLKYDVYEVDTSDGK